MRCLLEGGAYFHLIVKWRSAHFRSGGYQRKYGKAEDAQCSQQKPKRATQMLHLKLCHKN